MLDVIFLPYGRVDAILIRLTKNTGEKAWAFIDGGYRRDGKKAVAFMQRLGITRLDAYIATHRHRNHVGAGPVIIANIPVNRVIYSHPDMKERLLSLCSCDSEKEAIKKTSFRQLRPGLEFYIGDANFTCLGPEKIAKCSAGAYKENRNSLILRCDYKRRFILFTGDTSGDILSSINPTFFTGMDALKVDILKNPHHNGALGSKLLERIGAKVVVVCNGKDPAKYYVKRIAQSGARLYTAGNKAGGDGMVTISMDDKNCYVNTDTEEVQVW